MTKRVLTIQSYVAYGHVGNAVAMFVFQRTGHDVMAVPTVIYSNHPGHGRHTGRALPAAELNDLLTGLADNGWFGPVDAVLTGYLGEAAQAEVLASHIRNLKERFPRIFYCCDPVCGDDDKGLYVDPAIAEAMRTQLLPLADIATPNRFELEYLLGPDKVTGSIEDRVRRFPCPTTLCTSVRLERDHIGEILATPDNLTTTRQPFLDSLPKGTGDLYTSVFVAKLLHGIAPGKALAATSAVVHEILKASRGQAELALVAHQSLLA